MLLDPNAQPSAMEMLEPLLAYEGAAVEHHLAAIGAERDRLRSVLADAEVNRDELLSSRPLSVIERLGTVMLEAQAKLSEEWEACRGTEAAIEDATEAAVTRVLADARAHAASLRAIADELRTSQAGAAEDETDQWWDVVDDADHVDDVPDVIDLTRRDAPEQARTA